MEHIRSFIMETKAPDNRVLGVDSGSGADILAIGEALGESMEADALLLEQKYAGRLKKICRNVLTGELDGAAQYGYIALGNCVNHYSNVDTLVGALGRVLVSGGHMYATFSNEHVYDRIFDLFAYGSGQVLKPDAWEQKRRSYIEFDELLFMLRRNGMVVCNMEPVDPVELSQLEQNIRRFTDNEDFMLTVLNRVRHWGFELDIIRG